MRARAWYQPDGGKGRKLLLLAVAILTMAGCVRGCTSGRPPIHPNSSMDQQPRYDPQSESEFLYDGASMSAPVPGTVARGEWTDDSPFFTGKDGEDQFVASIPIEIDAKRLVRGKERFEIYCAPCHTVKGTGKGILYKLGQVPTPSFRDERLLALADGQIFDVISNGTSLMPSYRYPIPVEDRWAIVAHLRTLQQRSRR